MNHKTAQQETVYNPMELGFMLTEWPKELQIQSKPYLNQKSQFTSGVLSQDTKLKSQRPDFNQNFNLNLVNSNSQGLFVAAEADRFTFINSQKLLDSTGNSNEKKRLGILSKSNSQGDFISGLKFNPAYESFCAVHTQKQCLLMHVDPQSAKI